ncbi:MAG: protein BatD [Alphaproteobacteria bacterium]|nr:protein BatD [Alphaproteobacteria bacterium]MBP7759581.1 protein BatD [Alphaproteobacteria bacterium]MBP7762978.1 protein BatD [Alphaproteobacteria bacterium]MBP7904213.1 protein BatD [Alphaproteobacteria bacterium]
MVKTRHFLVFLTFILMLCGSWTAWAASLKAQTDRSEVSLNQTLTLTLTLEGANKAGTPDFSALKGDFRIVSRGQSSNFSIINGAYESQIVWNLVLQPLHEGKITIPELSVQTDQGVVNSQTLKLIVKKTVRNTNITKNKQGRDVYIDAAVSDRTPYRNSPVVFTVRLVAAAAVSDISFGELKIDNALVEKQGEPKVYDEIQGARSVKIIELRYLVTPLQDGPLKIPSFVFQGMVRGQARSTSPFGGTPQDPFGIFQDFAFLADIMGQPFTLTSDEIMLEVKKDAAQMDPWLPAEDLKISDALEGAEKAKVGEPLYRHLTLVAKGNVGTILPDLNGKIASESDFRIYAETPQTGLSISEDGKLVSGWREEIYTLIPQNGGALTLPEIKVPWWDIRNNKIAYATLPARTINVAGGIMAQAGSAQSSLSNPGQTAQQQGTEPEEVNPKASELLRRDAYILSSLAVLAALATGLAILFWRRKRIKTAQPMQPKETVPENKPVIRRPIPQPANEDKISPADLHKVATLDELKKMIVTFAVQRAGVRPAASLKDIAQHISKGLEGDMRERSEKLFARLEAALYAGQETPFEPLKEDFARVLEQYARPKKDQAEKVDRLGALNPS